MNKTKPNRPRPLIEQLPNRQCQNLLIALSLIFLCPLGFILLLKYRPHWLKKIPLVIAIIIYAIIWCSGFVFGIATHQTYQARQQAIYTLGEPHA